MPTTQYDKSLQPVVDRETASRLILEHRDLARKLAARYLRRGEPWDDLVQVATLGLVQAAHRFDPERGKNFVSFAVPTILGELRRHFRDRCWAIRIPRPLHDLYHSANAAQDRLCGRLGRMPTTRELANELDADHDDVLAALEGGSAYSAMSLDAPASDEATRQMYDALGDEDSTLDTVVDREAVRNALEQIPERERRILVLWFFGDRTQSQIAEELGISQMHVSRLLASTLSKLRTSVLEDSADPIRWSKPRRAS